MKKILLLGGSDQQLPAIEYALRKNYETILCDFLPDNPGRKLVDKYYCVSTTDKEAVLSIAREEKIDGILAYASDPAAPVAAYVADILKLPTSPLKSIEILTNKDKFRNFLAKNNFNTPKAKGFNSYEEAKKEIKDFKLPVMVKPVDSSGSKGVNVLINLDNLESVIKTALNFSKNKRFIIEEFVESNGYQVAGDGFSIEGTLVFRCFANDHFNIEGLAPFVPISASIPYIMPERIHQKIHSEIQRLLDLLSMGTSAYNFDIRIDNRENIYLMEVGPRSGGNYIPQVTKYATGIDMVEYALKAAMGESCDGINMIHPKGFWSYYAIHSDREGILKEIEISDIFKEKHVVDSFLKYKAGDKIPAFTGANTALGILIMTFQSLNEMIYMMDNPQSWVNVIIE